nr:MULTISPECIES: hypothetical protein [unclassified Allomuricauda]|tara:strand:- start:651 stop:827 length:177 start_codon:yes stop_codon:yes gene_type:complete
MALGSVYFIKAQLGPRGKGTVDKGGPTHTSEWYSNEKTTPLDEKKQTKINPTNQGTTP